MNDILLKPFIILALEPMLLAVTLYMSFVYGLVYLLFEAYPFVVSIYLSTYQYDFQADSAFHILV